MALHGKLILNKQIMHLSICMVWVFAWLSLVMAFIELKEHVDRKR
jgi:hypothetical protein